MQIGSENANMQSALEYLYWSGPFGIILIDQAGVILDINPRQATNSRIKPEDVIGKTVLDVFSTVIRRYGFVEPYRQLIEERKPLNFQVDEYQPQYFKKVTRFRLWGFPLEDAGKYILITEDVGIERYDEPPGIIGSSKTMEAVFAFIQRASLVGATVLIEGESGTGKELVARAIHASSKRRNDAFLALNCGALPAPLLASTLFGHERGAFTGAESRVKGYFESADGGTLFLDEFAEASQDVQVKFLRVLQDGVVTRLGGTEPIRTNARVICATNKNLDEEVRRGRLRRDLYYRINILYIRIPPLRERLEDLPLLVRYFLSELDRRHRFGGKHISSDLMDFFYSHPWPGNVRELANVLESAYIMCPKETITSEYLPPWIQEKQQHLEDGFPVPLSYREALAQFQGAYLKKLGERFGNDWTAAARQAGVNPSTLYRMRANVRRGTVARLGRERP